MSFTPQSIANRLQGHPELLKRFDEILNIVEASSGNVDKASEAEQLVIDQLRHLGNEVIHDWAVCKEKQKADEVLDNKGKIERNGKKNVKWNTTYGEIVVKEMIFIVNNHTVRPFSHSADLSSRCCSIPLERRIADFGADVPFGKVHAKIMEHYGISLPFHLSRTITERHAKKINELVSLKQDMPKVSAEVIIAETDGSMIPIVTIVPKTSAEESSDARKRRQLSWKEGRLSLAHKLGCIHPVFNATMGSTEETGDQLLDCAIQAGCGENSKVHCVGDGATWINEQVHRVFSDQGSYLIDFMHLCEYLAPASKGCSPNDNLDWLEKQKSQMKAGNVADVIKALEPHMEAVSIPDKDAPVRRCHRYISNRLDQFDYKSAIEANLPIGSGEIESAHRYVIQKRLKLPGAWWLESNAQNMLALRVLRENGGWNNYWVDNYSYRQTA